MKKGSKRKNKKILILFAIILTVGVAFAALQKYLQINGSASIDSRFDIRIMSIEKESSSGGAYERTNPTFTDTSATFNVGLIKPGDTIKYKIIVYNAGTINAKLDDLNKIEEGSSNITYTITGIEKGDIVANGTEKEIFVEITYSGTSSEEVNKELTLQMLFVQTSEKTTEQEEIQAELEAYVPSIEYSLESYDFEKDKIKVRIAEDYGDGPGMPMVLAEELYDGDNLISSNSLSESVYLSLGPIYNFKSRYVYDYSGTIFKSQFSEVDEVFFSKNAVISGPYIAKVDNKTSKAEILGYTGGRDSVADIELSSYVVGYGALSSVNTPNIVKLTNPTGDSIEGKLKWASLKGVKQIINLTGKSYNWGTAIGYTGSTNCTFETGTCDGVTITNVE